MEDDMSDNGWEAYSGMVDRCDELESELATVTARLAAATTYRYQFDKGHFTVSKVNGYGDAHWSGHEHNYLCRVVEPVYFRTLEEAFLWLDPKLTAAVSAGWKQLLGEGGGE